MSGIQQMLTGGTYKAPGPTTIGQAFGGGYYAGQIAVGGGGVATHYLIVSPKASGESSQLWSLSSGTTGITSVINGPTNTASLVALGDAYAAMFCNNLNSGGGLNGYTDWYLPAKNELEVIYYFLKPSTTANRTSPQSGANANAVSPEPISTYYTSGSPAQTSSGINFRLGESEAFTENFYWSSTEFSSTQGCFQYFAQGEQSGDGKQNYDYVRAVRRAPV